MYVTETCLCRCRLMSVIGLAVLNGNCKFVCLYVCLLLPKKNKRISNNSSCGSILVASDNKFSQTLCLVKIREKTRCDTRRIFIFKYILWPTLRSIPVKGMTCVTVNMVWQFIALGKMSPHKLRTLNNRPSILARLRFTLKITGWFTLFHHVWKSSDSLHRRTIRCFF